MKPLKLKHIIPVVAQQLNLPVDQVEVVTNYYWEEVRQSLTQLKYVRIHLTNLGDFTVKHWLLDKYVQKYSGLEQQLAGKQEVKEHVTIMVNEKLNLLKRMKDYVEDELQRKDFIKQFKKHKHESDQQYHTHMEEQGTDHGGYQQ